MDIIVDGNYEGKLIREVLKKDFGYSMNLIKKLKFSPDGIKVNGEWVTVRYVLKKGDVLSLATEDKPSDVSPYIIPVDLPIEVVYEDEYLTAVNKPYNMPSHPSLGHKLDTVANALAYRYRDSTYVFRPVNRLDRDTSGCMLTANTKDASYKLYSSMVDGLIRKTYIAVLDSVPSEHSGRIETYMRRRENSIIEREVCSESDSDAKLAVTDYTVLCEKNGKCIVAAHPITGRTHQIRVHFASIGCPLLGDTLYGREGTDKYISRHALHSWKTEFPHPMDGHKMIVTAPIPSDMMRLIGDLDFKENVNDILDKVFYDTTAEKN